eukprot:355232-Chlamydomonas_euryale.AAC.3
MALRVTKIVRPPPSDLLPPEDGDMAPSDSTTAPLLPQQYADAESPPEEMVGFAEVTFADIAREFFILGWIGFGGPQAHIGLFQRVSASDGRARDALLLPLQHADCT